VSAFRLLLELTQCALAQAIANARAEESAAEAAAALASREAMAADLVSSLRHALVTHIAFLCVHKALTLMQLYYT
jgi:hypothetical protein